LLLFTGQHPALDPAEFGLDGFQSRNLGCPGQLNPYDHARAVEERMRAELVRPPSLLVVQGDTSSAYGAARAGFVHGIPVAHVEAGLRTHDARAPWPEEEFRCAIDARAELLFAPTALNAANLAGERNSGSVHVTGNSGIDSLLRTKAEVPTRLRESGRPRLLVTCHRRESWGPGLDEIAGALAAIAAARDVTIELVLHPNPAVAETLRAQLAGVRGIELIAPLPHRELIERMLGCDLVLSDSGGIQEEAPALGVPLLVLREKTERPEAIACGSARIVGVDEERIVAETLRLLDHPLELADMARPRFPFGEGRSGERIAAIVCGWLDGRKRQAFGEG
jgi:UDP-N-acetylglucosamine 2-epimerase (non-hydrolysing)